MSIYRPKTSPYYHFDYQFRGVRYHGSTNCVSKRDAEQFERDHRREAASGRKEKPSITLDEGAGVYWQDRGQFEKNASTTEYQIANVLRLVGGNTLIQDIDDLTVARMVSIRRGERAFPNRKRKKGAPPSRLVSAATVNREVELLKRILNFLAPRYRVGEIEWKRHKLKEPKERVREASPEEEAALFEVLREQYPDICDLVEFAMISGARRTAVTTLLWSKVDLRRSIASVHTKGGEWHSFPLTQRLREIIANRPKVGPFVFTYVCERPSPARKDRPRRVKGERYPFSKEGWYRKWYRALAEAGISDFRFHDLRHTAATRISRTNGIQAAQRLLGHSRIETTTRYAHTSDADLLAAMENVELSRNSPEAGKSEAAENGRKPHLRRVK